MISRAVVVVLVAAALLLPAAASAQFLSPIGQEEIPKYWGVDPETGEDLGAAKRFEQYGEAGFTGFMERELEKVMKMDLYGVTSQLPQGYMSAKWQWDMLTAKNRYDRNRKLGPVFQPITFEMAGETQLAIDLGLSGEGGGHTFQFSYGITDPIDWYIEFPFMHMNLSFNPQALPVDDQGNRIGTTAATLLGVSDRMAYSGEEFMCNTLNALGRPTPGYRYKSKWLMGDINTGFSWNVFRTKYLSGALTVRVFFPTGYRPKPENNLTYATGPELEVGIGGWAVGFTQGYDVHVYQHSWWFDLVVSTEFAASYAFEQERDYPTNFPVPGAAASLDPAAFPDLSQLTGKFKYTPGWGVDWLSKVNLRLFGIGFEAGYGVRHMQKPGIKGDAGFISMVDSLELLGQSTVWAVQLGASVSLLPLYVPVEIGFSWRKIVDGKDVIVFDDYYQVIVKAYIPIWPK